ncbi:MAG: 4a-hydroxytetrahydrobiopterin dehydratase [Gammaproteobacteria bacterium]|nr:4a-hydroxytetrahydrobiopterin dehydratase [Gammaproteobacteria bacterium]MCD8525315.1 4a-hydroxytetrahydrobiopterin dehydratase [Gammaproteobacteria bacterium]
MICDLSNKTCVPCEGNAQPLTPEQVSRYMVSFHAWEVNSEFTELSRCFIFKNYYHVMAFVNAVAFIAHHEKHHPDLSVHYNRVVVRYSTHAISGLSENDFICAAKIDELAP